MVSRQIDFFDGKIPTFYDSQTVDATNVELRELGQRVSDITVHMRAWGSPNHGERDVGILRLVCRYRGLFCTEPRDKVYVLLEVSHLYPGVELPIAYTISVLDVYKNLAKYVIAGSARPDILTYAGHDQCVSQNVSSWVPNWQHYDSLRRMVCVPWYAFRNLSSVINTRSMTTS
jgi:hypothetical protein